MSITLNEPADIDDFFRAEVDLGDDHVFDTKLQTNLIFKHFENAIQFQNSIFIVKSTPLYKL